MQRKVDIQRVKQSKETGRKHTPPQCHQKGHNHQNPQSKPEEGRNSSPRHNSTGRLLALVAPLLQKPLIQSKKEPMFPIGAQLLAWPDLTPCTDALWPVEELPDAKWWWLVDGEGTDTWRRPGAAWKWVSGIWDSLTVENVDVGREDREGERRGKRAETGDEKKRK